MKNKSVKFLSLFFVVLFLSQCGGNFFRKTDARKIPVQADERVQQNLEQGRRIRFGTGLGGGSGNFEFASSNELWRATIDILDFIPLNNADYGGGVIITDWYSNDLTSNEQIKIMVRFLSNEIRADGIEITVYKKVCSLQSGIQQCSNTSDDSKIGQELKVAILKKAAIYKIASDEKAAKEFNKNRRPVTSKNRNSSEKRN